MKFIKLERVSENGPDFEGIDWFNLGIGAWHLSVVAPGLIHRSVPVWPYNAFRRVYKDPEHDCWGFGLLQVGGRHLIAIISNEEQFQIDLAFMHLVYRRFF